MVLSHFPTDIDFDFNNKWAIVPQVLCFIPLIWFSYKSINLVVEELKNHYTTIGNIPVLSIIYMLFSIVFTLLFILNFGEIIEFNHRMLLDKLNHLDKLDVYLVSVKLLTVATLLAFTFNFCKAFFTLNALEFSKLNNNKLSSLFNSEKKKIIAEGIIRFFIALLFILLEKELATSSEEVNSKADDFLIHLGVLTFLLYALLLIWILVFRYWFDKEKSLESKSSNWYLNSFKQFGSGLVIAVFILVFGYRDYFEDYYKYILIGGVILGIIASSIIILQIIKSEFMPSDKSL